MNIQSILVPVDYSDCSAVALAYTAELAFEVGAPRSNPATETRQ